jgi:uncharacterized damage-inducible protein DinB
MAAKVKPSVMAGPLTLSPGDARAIFEYNRAVFDRFARRLSRLPWPTVTAERQTGHHTLFDTLVHILHVQEAWLVYVVPGRSRELSRRFREADRHPTTWEGFRTYSDRVWTETAAVVRSLSARDLRRTVKAPWMPGRYTVADALLQATVEQAHHLGEVIGALWQDDLPSPAMTWIDVRRTPTRSARRS